MNEKIFKRKFISFEEKQINSIFTVFGCKVFSQGIMSEYDRVFFLCFWRHSLRLARDIHYKPNDKNKTDSIHAPGHLI